MKPYHFIGVALLSFAIGISAGLLVSREIWIAREQRDFAATATSLNKQIKTELPKICAALGASGNK